MMSPAGYARARLMFGDYALYLDEKLIAIVGDNRFYLKITPAGREMLGENARLAPPYQGAKDAFLIEDFEDQDFFLHLLRASWNDLPEAKPRKKNKAQKN